MTPSSRRTGFAASTTGSLRGAGFRYGRRCEVTFQSITRALAEIRRNHGLVLCDLVGTALEDDLAMMHDHDPARQRQKKPHDVLDQNNCDPFGSQFLDKRHNAVDFVEGYGDH